MFWIEFAAQSSSEEVFLAIIDLRCFHETFQFLLKFICQKMKGHPSISGKKTIEESLVEASGIWVGEVVQDGLFKQYFVKIFLKLS